MYFLLRVLAALPLPLLYVFSATLSFVAFDLLRWRRAQIDRDLSLAFPERSAAECSAIRNESCRRFTDVFFEAIRGARARADDLARRVVFDNPEVIADLAARGQSVVLLTPHFCNWEWLLQAGGIRFGFPIDAVYQPARLAGLDRFLRESRSRFGGSPIPQGDFVFALMSRSGSQRGYALIADQTPPRRERKYWTRLLNRDTAFFVGAEKVARFLDSPVLYVAMRRIARGRYAARFHVLAAPPFDDADAPPIMEGFARRLEAEVRASPADFLWLQKRWKYPRPPDE
jgi:KDO2-lipid IV(A) lauroyltransferase